jgi:hypothetical protein
MQHYLEVVGKRGAATFGDVAKGRQYKFLKSWSSPLSVFPGAATEVPKKSRSLEEGVPSPDAERRWRLREYQDTVLTFLDDYSISPEEAEYARGLRSNPIQLRIFALPSWRSSAPDDPFIS